jgi:hypothetical protein
MFEVVEEWLEPFSLLHRIRGDCVDLAIFGYKLQDRGKKSSFFNIDLRGFTIG